MSQCTCHCHRELPECEDSEFNRLLQEKKHLLSIKEYLSEAKRETQHHTPLMNLIIAVEQLWIIEKRRVNKHLIEKGIIQIRR